MIEKMKYVNIMGHMNNLDTVINNYIANYDIQLEEALKEFHDVKGLRPCVTNNEYTSYFQKAMKFANTVGIDSEIYKNISKEEAFAIVDKASDLFDRRHEGIKELEEKRDHLVDIIGKLEHYIDLDFNMEDLGNLKFIKCRFGKMPLTKYQQFLSYVYDDINMIFLESRRDENYVYGVYFFAETLKEKSDNLLKSFNLEMVNVPFEFDNVKFTKTPYDTYKDLEELLKETDEKIRSLQAETLFSEDLTKEDILEAYVKIRTLFYNSDIRKYAARTPKSFFVFVGWMSERDVRKLDEEIDKDLKVILTYEDSKEAIVSKPPTKLKNNAFVRPFEYFVRAYGVPNYNEIDPTPFVAITYTILFGMMFGDLGQGAVVSLLGFFLYKFKKIKPCLIMVIVGISSMVFGVLYGSVFGSEDIIPALWMRPFNNTNTILLTAIGIGMFLILVVMVFNIINAIKSKDKARLYFSSNGISGLIFYTGIIGIILSLVSGNSKLAGILACVCLIIPIILITFKEPLGRKLEGKKKLIEGSKGMFFLETFVELFETLLTYFTNTVSFVRVGAFALSHAGMMSVVYLIANSAPGPINPIVVIIGNIFIMGLEGVVVAIQVLRIQFYEMFSRYYEGTGREFTPDTNKLKNLK